MLPAVRIRREILLQLRQQARAHPKTECCGLLAGREGVITRVLPARNALESPTAFEIAPAELFRLMREIRAAGLELLGIYHSHLTGENRPSARDIERAYYPEAAYCIVSPQPDIPHPVRLFSIRDQRVLEMEMEVE